MFLITGVADEEIFGSPRSPPGTRMSTLTQRPCARHPGRRQIRILYVALRFLEGLRKYRSSALTMASLIFSASRLGNGLTRISISCVGS